MSENNSMPGPDAKGQELYDLITELYPIHRSMTGHGFRETLRHIQKRIPLTVHEVPTGTHVFDWTVPKEWNIEDAYVKNSKGERVIDLRQSNLHVVGYSIPVRGKRTLKELKPHLFSLPDRPDWVPYRTSYFQDSWGFCLAHNRLSALQEDEYDICIDSRLEDGSLNYGEYYVQGGSDEEVLVSCHACHPSLCNDNLSGIAVAVLLAQHLSAMPRRHSYRFLFIPTTIGSITWLALNEDKVSRIKNGLVLSCLGDSGPSTYKRSRQGDAEIDRAAAHVLKQMNGPYNVLDFVPYGYDERQFCSPGFNLPVGCFMRTPNGRYPEYHTSADDLDFVKAGPLADSFEKCVRMFDILEHNRVYVNLNPKCEPQLGRRGIYQGWSSRGLPELDLALLWVLNLSDGRHSLLDIAERAHAPFALIKTAADLLQSSSLVEESREAGRHEKARR